MMKNQLRWRLALLLLLIVGGAAACDSEQEPATCATASDCPDEKPVCGLDGQCTAQTQSCRLHNECGPEEFCKSGTCASAKCESHGDCGDLKQYICLDSLCVTGCVTSENCGPNSTCNTETHQCEQSGCTENSCADGEVCDLNTKKCKLTNTCSCEETETIKKKASESDASFCKRLSKENAAGKCALWAVQEGLEGTYYCDSRTCVKESCNSKNDCGEGEICHKNQCVVGCLTESDCPRGGGSRKVCERDPLSVYEWKTCKEGCLENRDCLGTQFCSGKICRDKCTSSTTCENGLTCRQDEDIAGVYKRCQGCRHNGDCEGEDVCTIEAGQTLGTCGPRITCPVDDYEHDTSAAESIVGNWSKEKAFEIEALPFVTDGATAGKLYPNFCAENISVDRTGEWFKISPTKGNIVSVVVTPQRSGADLNLSVTDNNGNIIISDRRKETVAGSGATGEVKFYVPESAGDEPVFYINVTGFLDASNPYVPYSLSVTEEADTCDRSQPNQSLQNAIELRDVNYDVAADVRREEVSAVKVCHGQSLWYKFTPGDNRIVKITQSAQYRMADIEHKVLKGGSTAPATQEGEEDEVKRTLQFETDTQKDVVYYYQVTAREYGSDAEFEFEVVTEKNVCADDYDTNSGNVVGCNPSVITSLKNQTASNLDTDRSASTIYPFFGTNQNVGSNEALEANLCKTQDYYCIGVPPKAGFDFYFCKKNNARGNEQITFKGPSACNVNLAGGNAQALTVDEVVADNGINKNRTSNADWADYTGGCVKYQFRDLEQGIYCAEVGLRAGSRLEYRFGFVSQSAGVCPADSVTSKSAADAHTFDGVKAAKGMDNVVNDSFLCDTAEGWYKVKLEKAGSIKFDVNYVVGGGDLDTYLYVSDNESCEGNLQQLASSTGEDVSGVTSVEYAGGEAGKTYCLKVTPQGYARTYYGVQLTLAGKTAADRICPDQFEQNDEPEHATDLTSLLGQEFTDLMVCSNISSDSKDGFMFANPPEIDEDYFKLPIKAGQKIKATVTSSSGVYVRVAFFDTPPGSRKIVTDNRYHRCMGTCERESVASHDTDAYVVVNTPFGGRFKYSLKVELEEAPACPPDSQNNHDKASAQDLGSTDAVVNKAMLCSENEVDWYKITVPKKKRVALYTRYNKLDDILTTTVVDDNDVPVSGSDSQIGFYRGDKFVIPSSDQDKVYYIKVSSTKNVRSRYALGVVFDSTSDASDKSRLYCPDAYEENNTIRLAKKLESTRVEDLLLCRGESDSKEPVFYYSGNDSDYFSVEVDAHATLTVDVLFEDGVLGSTTVKDDSVDLTLYDAKNQSLETAKVTNKKATVTHKNDTDRPVTYKLLVKPSDGGESMAAFYTLSYKVEYDATKACTPPDMSKHIAKTKDTATTAIPKFDDKVSICNEGNKNEEQWYYLGDTITSFDGYISFLSELGEVEMALIDGNGTVIKTVTTSGGRLEKTGLTSGTKYYLRIQETTRPLARRMNYKLWFKTSAETPTVEYCGDKFEYNDESSSAHTVALSDGLFLSTEPRMCKAEEDWYKIAFSNANYTVALLGDGKLTLDLYKTDNTSAAVKNVTAGTADTVRISEVKLEPAEASNYYIKVAGGEDGKSLPYGLLAFKSVVFDSATTCPKDAFDKAAANESKQSGTDIAYSDIGTKLSPAYATICGGDVDWYKITNVPNGKELVVTLYSVTGAPLKLLKNDSSNLEGYSVEQENTTGSVSGNFPITFTSPSNITVFGVKGDGQKSFPYFITVKEKK